MQQAQSEGVVSAMSQATDVQQVAQELARQLLHPHLGFVLFFLFRRIRPAGPGPGVVPEFRRDSPGGLYQRR